MKKIISILLSVLMVASCVSVGFAAEKKADLKFAVASDLHYNVPEEELTASGEIDDIIDTNELRARLCSALLMLSGKNTAKKCSCRKVLPL